MSYDFGKVSVKVAAVLAIAFGFALGGIELWDHILSKGESGWAMVPFAIAGAAILWGALILQRDDTAKALDKMKELIPLLGPLLASRKAGGDRATDPPPGGDIVAPTPISGQPSVLPAPNHVGEPGDDPNHDGPGVL